MTFKAGDNLKLSQRIIRKSYKEVFDIGVEKINVEFISFKPKSRTICLVKVLERGKGWDEESKSYKGIRRKSSWCRGENSSFGKIIECNIKNLK